MPSHELMTEKFKFSHLLGLPCLTFRNLLLLKLRYKLSQLEAQELTLRKLFEQTMVWPQYGKVIVHMITERYRAKDTGIDL